MEEYFINEFICKLCYCKQESCFSCKDTPLCGNCISCCCSNSHVSWRSDKRNQAIILQYISTLWLIIEALGTIGIGILSSSLSLIAFGSDTIIELLSSTIVLGHLKSESDKFTASDKKIERITAYLLTSLIPVIALTAFYSYFVRAVPEASPIGIVLTFISIPIMFFMWKQKSRIGKEINCKPLVTDGSESAICVLMAVTTLSGLLINYFFSIHWIDYVATVIILLFIAKEAKEALSNL